MSLLKSSVVVVPNLLTTYIMSIMATYLTDVWELSITHAAAIVNLYSGMVGIIPVGLLCIVYMTGFTVLSGADIVAAYAIWTFVTYLTDVWDLGVTQAAGIFNLYYGIINIMPLFTQYIVDALLGNYWMLLLSSYAFLAGFGALSLSTPPMLGWATGTCTAYEAECIGPVQKILFYTALPLIAVGITGQATSLVQLVHDERPEWLGPLTFTAPITSLVQSAHDQTTPESGLSSSSVMIAQLIALSRFACGQTPESNGPFVFTPGMRGLALAVVCILGYVTSWSIKYGVSALVIIMASFSFVALSPCFYKRVTAQGVPVKWKETKIILLVTLVGALFMAMSVVSAIGNTYFVLQASHLNQKVWFVKFPLPILLFVYNEARSKFGGLKRSVVAISLRLAASMVLASLCCVVAALVEARRLGVVKRSGLIDLPDVTIPMTMFWLVPQFVLLGCADGIFRSAIGSLYMVALISDEEATNLEASKVLQCQYAGFYDMAVYGVGVMGSVLSVHVVGEISAEGGKINWFQHTLNTSRLDNYYWTLAALVAINLLILFVLAVCCGACFYVVSRFKDAKFRAAPAVDEPLLQQHC